MNKQSIRLVILVGIIFTSTYGFQFTLRFILGTENPMVVVKGESMVPTYYDGDLLIIRGLPDKTQIEVGDIIVFHNPYALDTLIVHRVVKKTVSEGGLVLITKGDNNHIQDQWRVQEEHVVGGVLQRIPYLGEVLTAIKSPFGLGIILCLIIFVYVVDLIYQNNKVINQPLEDDYAEVIKR